MNCPLQSIISTNIVKKSSGVFREAVQNFDISLWNFYKKKPLHVSLNSNPKNSYKYTNMVWLNDQNKTQMEAKWTKKNPWM